MRNTYNSTANKQSTLKMGKGTEQTFLQRRHADGQQVSEKVLNIIVINRNINQNYEYHLIPAIIKKLTER